MLVEGKIYHISGFIVVPAQASYKVNVYPFSIRLLKNTFVKVINEDNNSIPFDRFEFLNFESVKSRCGDKTFLTGIYIILFLLP